MPIRKHFGPRRAVTVTDGDLDTYITTRRETDKRAPATINRETQILGQALRMKVRGMALPNPPTVRWLRENNARQDFFDAHEFEALVSALPRYLQDFVRFAYQTGWRKGELVALQWSHVHRADAEIRIPDSKNGEPRTLGLDDALMALIDRRWHDRAVTRRGRATIGTTDLVFHGNNGRAIGDFRDHWTTACRAAGLVETVTDDDGTVVTGKDGEALTRPSKLFHGLRRTAVRDMVRSGVPEHVAMKVSGHKTRSMLDRYNIVDARDTRAAMVSAAAYRQAAPAPPPWSG